MTVGGGGTDVGVSDGVCARAALAVKSAALPSIPMVVNSFFMFVFLLLTCHQHHRIFNHFAWRDAMYYERLGNLPGCKRLQY